MGARDGWLSMVVAAMSREVGGCCHGWDGGKRNPALPSRAPHIHHPHAPHLHAGACEHLQGDCKPFNLVQTRKSSHGRKRVGGRIRSNGRRRGAAASSFGTRLFSVHSLPHIHALPPSKTLNPVQILPPPRPLQRHPRPPPSLLLSPTRTLDSPFAAALLPALHLQPPRRPNRRQRLPGRSHLLRRLQGLSRPNPLQRLGGVPYRRKTGPR